MTGYFVRIVVLAALAAAPVLAQGISREPVNLTPHYSVQNTPNADESEEEGETANTGQTPPKAAPAPQVEDAALPASTTTTGNDPRSGLGEEPADENVRVSLLRRGSDDSYLLGPGDKLRLIVFGEDDISGTYEVDGQGYVRLPLVGTLAANGLTASGLEQRIAAAYVHGGYLLKPKVNVEITGYRPFYIIGEVSKPGEYPYVNAMSALNAIALAGGFTDRAVTSSLYVRHHGDPVEREVALDETTRIMPGDVVRVGRTTYWTVMTFLAPLMSPFTAAAYMLK